jgi:regulator of sirC expression with transglutaminase-like and TPR domain
MRKIAESETLRPYLQHSKLKEIIKFIDGAKHRKKELHKRMKNDGEFMKFIDMMLKELGYINEQG